MEDLKPSAEESAREEESADESDSSHRAVGGSPDEYASHLAGEKAACRRLFHGEPRDYPQPPSLKCSARNFLTVLREALKQYITFNRGGGGSLTSCT
jgi:hypothetical protein